MLNRLHHSLTAILLAALAAPGIAQSLVGRVVDPAGHGIAGVTVLFSNGGPTTVATDATGAFNITGLNNRTYNTVEFRGPANAWTAIQLASVRVQGATTLPNVVLQPGALVSGALVGPAGPVVGGNINVYDLHGNKLFTPNDATGVGGAFSVVAPLGATVVRAVPPVGSGLIPVERQLTLTGPINLGTLTSRVGYTLTGIVVDNINGVPIPGVTVQAFDGLTGAEIAQLAPQTSAFGSFSLSVPYGFYELQLTPPAGNAHVPRQVFGVIVIGNRAYGQIAMERGVFVSGTVSGPSGLIASADIDVYTPEGHKLWTPKDNTDATGTFHITLPIGNYRFTAQPPASFGLTGVSTGLVAVTALGGSIGNMAAQPGVALTIPVTGPTGAVGNANLNFVNPATGQVAVLVNDHANAAGLISAIVPTGTWNLVVGSPQGNLGATSIANAVAITAATNRPVTLPLKRMMVNVQGVGIQAVGPNGAVPLHITVNNPSATSVSVLAETFVQLTSGVEVPVFPGVPFTLPGNLAFTSYGVFMPVPAIPTAEKGKLLRYIVRMRNPANSAIIDEAYAEFVAY